MRIRSTKPEFWRSERIASVSWDARLVLKGLESYVDDNGVGKDDIALIVADVFPRDLSGNPPGTLRRVSEAISALENAGLLWRYEVDGARLLYISFWESVQRIEKPSKGRFRRPDGTIDYRDSDIRASLPEPSRNPPGTLRPGTGDQRNRGSVEKDSCASADAERDSDPDAHVEAPIDIDAKRTEQDRERTRQRDQAIYAEFDQWWQQYPRKRGKGQAMKAYRAARRKTDPQTLIDAVRRQTPTLTAKGDEFCPYPATWLNGERWTDQDNITASAPARDMHGRRIIGGGW